MRILAVDHGEKRIGLALSDGTGTIASPLKVIEHLSRSIDAAQVADLAAQNDVALIVVGQSFDEEGNPNPAGRRAGRFADELKNQTNIPIEMCDESFSTQDGHQDAFAAVVILQSYLESNRKSKIVNRKS
jgi:putative holliday junction resolvase